MTETRSAIPFKDTKSNQGCIYLNLNLKYKSKMTSYAIIIEITIKPYIVKINYQQHAQHILDAKQNLHTSGKGASKRNLKSQFGCKSRIGKFLHISS
jgi:hypothetical protein